MKDVEKECGCHNVLAFSSLHEQFPWHQSFLMVCNHWLHLFSRKCFFQWLHLFLWKWQHRNPRALNPLYWLQAASLRTKIKEDHPGTPGRKRKCVEVWKVWMPKLMVLSLLHIKFTFPNSQNVPRDTFQIATQRNSILIRDPPAV